MENLGLMKIDTKEPGKYGDPVGQKICGVQTDAFKLPTRLHQWRIEKCTADKSPTIRHSKISLSGSGCDRENEVAAQPPWSSVNNCTEYNYIMHLNSNTAI